MLVCDSQSVSALMEFVEGRTVGIDLGTSNSALSYLDDAGHPVVARNPSGHLMTPSIVTMLSDRQVNIGDFDPDAVADPENVVIAIKRHMGNPDFALEFGQRRLTPEFLSALILRKLREDAEPDMGQIANAVISVPYYFNDACRRATAEAGQIAGLNVIDIINEPTAATLAYAWICGDLGIGSNQSDEEKTILVYDLGGGTFDVTVVEYCRDEFRVLATDGDTFLGGLDWTKRIVDHVGEQMKSQYNIDPRADSSTSLHLLKACEEAKHELQRNQVTRVDVPVNGTRVGVQLTRGTFEDITADLLQRTRDTTELVLDECRKTTTDLDDIVLIGGATRMAAVPRMLERLVGRKPASGVDPQLAVAQGAAIHSAMLEVEAFGAQSSFSETVQQRVHGISSHDVNAHSLGVEIQDPVDRSKRSNHIMIPRNSRLPASVTQRFFTNANNPDTITVQLIEGEVPDIKACTPVGQCRISGLPKNLPIGTPVEISYSFDENRHIQVSARELAGNTEASVRIEWGHGLNEVGVENARELAGQYLLE